MNGDYYRIALEEVLLLLNGEEGALNVNPIHNQLIEDGSISLKMRKALRAGVEVYGLSEDLIPYDPDFIDGTATPAISTQEPGTKSEVITPEDITGPVIYEWDLDKQTQTTGEESLYDDVSPNDWYYEAVMALSKGGLFQGYDDGLFHPNDPITYGQWATVMSRVALDNYVVELKPGMHWAQPAYSKTTKDGICAVLNSPLGETLDSLYNRGQAIYCMYNLADCDKRGMKSRLEAAYTGKTWTFDDIPDGDLVQQGYAWTTGVVDHGSFYNTSTGRWVSQYVLGAYNLGITHGIDNAGTCNPTAPITRAEVAQLLYNVGVISEKQCDLRVGGIGS